MKRANERKTRIIFFITFVLILGFLAFSIIRVNEYNKVIHHETFIGNEFLNKKITRDNVCLKVIPRDSTWGKIFDFNNEGITENNYIAYTYDFTLLNTSRDQIKDYSFELKFEQEAYLSQAWNGAVEIHQKKGEEEYVATVPDLRAFNASDYDFNTVNVDGDDLIVMNSGDYLKYIPSGTVNAKEVPIESKQASTPGIIMYFPKEATIKDLSLNLSFQFQRNLKSDLLFRIVIASLFLWLIVLVTYFIIYMQLRKYRARHERDNKIIMESIETFTGFIDAKDPYTNGHSKRVANYTKMLARELGFEGEELEHIYYVALLHDCGKIGVPDNILDKPSRLTDEEFEIIKAHTIMGGEILKRFKSLKNVELGALFHHERYDGKGYPVGLVGEEIPLIARVICVADAYDAMNTNRIYRKQLSKEEIIAEIKKNKAKQFDPEIADIMLNLIKNGKIE